MRFFKEENPRLSFKANTLEIIQIDHSVYDAYNIKIDGQDFGNVLNRGGSWGVGAFNHNITKEDEYYLIEKAKSLK